LAGLLSAVSTLAGVVMSPLAMPRPTINMMTATGVVASWSASDVSTRAAMPGAMTGRAPKRSTQPPTVGRRNIDTMVMRRRAGRPGSSCREVHDVERQQRVEDDRGHVDGGRDP